MKNKVTCILILSMCIIGYQSAAKVIPMTKEVSASQKTSIIAQRGLRIINAVSDVKRGETGVITIQGIPNTLYSIKTSYRLANKTISVIQWRTTDATGVTTFNWIVSMKSIVGTYAATISGGGDVLNTKHTVLP